MRRRIVVLLGLLTATGVIGCRAPATADTSLAPLEAVVATPVAAPTKPARPIALNTAAASPVAETKPPVSGTPAAGAPAPTAPPAAAVAAATVAPPGTPIAALPPATATPTPAPAVVPVTSGTPAVSATAAPRELPTGAVKAEGSDDLKALTVQLDDRVDNLRQALREKDVDTSIRLQRELLGIISQADGTVSSEKSDLADKLRGVTKLLKQGLGGDLARIDDAAGVLRQLVGRPASTRTINDVYRYAGDLASKVAAFKKARAGGDVSTVFRVQSELLGEINRAQADLTPGRTKLTDAVLGALADVQAGLDGKLDRLDAGEAALNDIAKIPAQRSATPTVTPASGAAAAPGAPAAPAAAPAAAQPAAPAPGPASGGPAAPSTGAGATIPNVSTTPQPRQ